MEKYQQKSNLDFSLIKSKSMCLSMCINPEKGSAQNNKSKNLQSKIFVIYRNRSIKEVPSEKRYNPDLEKKWNKKLRFSLKESKYTQILSLIKQGTQSPKKVVTWLIPNTQKITLKLFNIKRQQYCKYTQSINPFVQENKLKELIFLPQKVRSWELGEVIGATLIYRSDICLSTMLLNLAETFHFYLKDTPVILFRALILMCTSEGLIDLMSRSIENRKCLLKKITNNIMRNCPSASLLTFSKIKMENFVEMWIEGAWLSHGADGSEIKQKILFYLLLNCFSFHSIVKVCQATIAGLSNTISRRNFSQTIAALTKPVDFLDYKQFYQYLFYQVKE